MNGRAAKAIRRLVVVLSQDGKQVQTTRCRRTMPYRTVSGEVIQVPVSAHGTLVWQSGTFRANVRDVKTQRPARLRPAA